MFADIKFDLFSNFSRFPARNESLTSSVLLYIVEM